MIIKCKLNNSNSLKILKIIKIIAKMNLSEICQYESSYDDMSIVEKPIKKTNVKRSPKIWLQHKILKIELRPFNR